MRTALLSFFLVFSLASVSASAEVPEFKPAVTDVTVFKDGHALVMARAKTKFSDGWCRTREVPAPVLGTFWAFAADRERAVANVRAEMVEEKETRPCLSLDELIQANTGRTCRLTEQLPGAPPATHVGTLRGFLEAEAARDEAAPAPPPVVRYNPYGASSVPLPAEETAPKRLSSFVMVQVDKDVRIIKRENIVNLTLAADAATTTARTREAREISLRVLDAKGKPVNADGEVGLVYLQKGIRWIPEYRIELLDGNRARITLQGTIINELADLVNVNARLVVGVPSFIMRDMLSPLALRENPLKLSSFFTPPAARPGQPAGWDYNAYLSNSMMSQAPAISLRSQDAAGGPNLPAEGQMEDLYLYHQPGLTLKKGARAVVQLLEVTVPYEDIYTYTAMPLPPRSAWRHMDQNRIRQLIAALGAPKVMHALRLTNSGKAPWTTGPAIVYKNGAPLAQQVLTYTSVQNRADLPLTVATDLNMSKDDTETKREPNALRLGSDTYTKVTLHGKLALTSFKDKPVKVVVTREVVGTINAASEGGVIRQVNAQEEAPAGAEEGYPWYYWTWWAFTANPVSEVAWDAEVPAGKTVTFEYDWHYYQHP